MELPEYDSKEILEQKLNYAVFDSSGFEIGWFYISWYLYIFSLLYSLFLFEFNLLINDIF